MLNTRSVKEHEDKKRQKEGNYYVIESNPLNDTCPNKVFASQKDAYKAK